MKHLQSKLNFKVWRVYDAIALAVDSIAVSVFALRRAGSANPCLFDEVVINPIRCGGLET